MDSNPVASDLAAQLAGRNPSINLGALDVLTLLHFLAILPNFT